ncbi:TetR/AcrR family transcriptional regulator [Granulicella cerasi]|uniref:TetR/AcrR family transcriptional regulator n=1 Tax=Granulicella cerasi TaxID=741063 RepID=A0ABW1Z8F4_9BACT|nr:TetR/AcrR family transcriptional regulator [Granulicella cerasi]
MEGDTAKRIIQVAHDLLAERGFSAFSFADIAEAVGIRKASIHHHFPTKTALVVTVLEQHRQRMEEGHAALDQHFASPAERLQKYVAHWEVCIRKQTEPICIAALLGAELPGLPEEVQAAVGEHFKCLRQWISKNLKLGTRQEIFKLQDSADIEAEMLMASVHGAMITARVNHSSTLFRQLTQSALRRITQS